MRPVPNHEGGSFYAATPPLMSPRISFSHGFADSHKKLGSYKEAAMDFEFTVENKTMKPAEEIFSKGFLVPSSKKVTTTTLRDQLILAEEGDHDQSSSEDVLSGFKSVSCRWIERWGTKKNLFGFDKSSSDNRKNNEEEIIYASKFTSS